jgi:hypothetical protein
VKHVRMLGLCLLAVLAVSAVAAVSASATMPEWGGCEAKEGGKYTDAACTEKASHKKLEGKYEWYTGTSFHHGYNANEYNMYPEIGPTTFETTTGKAIECSGGGGQLQADGAFNDGVPTKANELKHIILTFTGCQEAGHECNSPEYEYEGGVITNEVMAQDHEYLKGALVYLAGKGTADPTVGISLTGYEDKSSNIDQKILLTAICEGQGSIGTVWLGGETKGKNGKNTILSLVSPVDQMTTDFTQTFDETAGIQEPSTLEGGQLRTLDEYVRGGWERSGWSSTFNDLAEGGAPPIEIKAYTAP